jgi:hypothetical protein
MSTNSCDYFALAQRELRRAQRFQALHADILAAISYRNFQLSLARWSASLPQESETTNGRYIC